MLTLHLLAVVIVGYLIGNIPNGVLMARLFGWRDPRRHGSGHTGGLNSARSAGFAAGVLVMLLDILKGLLAVWVAQRILPEPVSIPLAGIAAVAGHNWPIFLGFRGGMGLATGAGALGGQYLPAVLIGLALVGLARPIIRHTPRAVIVAMLCLPPILWFLPIELPVFWLGTGLATLIALRHLSDWNRVYPSHPSPLLPDP